MKHVVVGLPSTMRDSDFHHAKRDECFKPSMRQPSGLDGQLPGDKTGTEIVSMELHSREEPSGKPSAPDYIIKGVENWFVYVTVAAGILTTVLAVTVVVLVLGGSGSGSRSTASTPVVEPCTGGVGCPIPPPPAPSSVRARLTLDQDISTIGTQGSILNYLELS